MARPSAADALDATSASILYEGANMSQLCILFKADDRVLKEKMHGIKPVGKRTGVPIYAVSEVAARMGKLSEEQVDAAMRRLNHADLPKMLTKEYWNGLRARQEFEIKNGDLWPTSKVISDVGEMVKNLKMELDLLTDAIERNTELTPRQRDVAMALVDGTKTNMLKRLREKFDPAPKAKAKPAPAIQDDDDDL